MAGASKIKESASLVSYEGQMLLDSFSQGGEQERGGAVWSDASFMNFSRGAQISMALSPPKGPASSQGLKLQCVNFGGGEFIGITARVSVNLLILILLQLCKKMLQCGNLGGEYQGFAK